jgi:XapX domain-containing protein
VKPYLISIAVGLLVGLIYSLLGVRSPAPPAIALLGLLGMLLGEQIVPIAKRIVSGKEVVAFLRTDCAEHVLGMPVDSPKDKA